MSVETDRQKQIAIEVGMLSVKTLPKTFIYSDLHNRVWEAFELGREYQKEQNEQNA